MHSKCCVRCAGHSPRPSCATWRRAAGLSCVWRTVGLGRCALPLTADCVGRGTMASSQTHPAMLVLLEADRCEKGLGVQGLGFRVSRRSGCQAKTNHQMRLYQALADFSQQFVDKSTKRFYSPNPVCTQPQRNRTTTPTQPPPITHILILSQYQPKP